MREQQRCLRQVVDEEDSKQLVAPNKDLIYGRKFVQVLVRVVRQRLRLFFP